MLNSREIPSQSPNDAKHGLLSFTKHYFPFIF